MSSTDPTTGSAASPAEPDAARAGPGRHVGALPPGLSHGELVSAVRAALEPDEEPVAVAASGGPDSAGLLRLAAEAVDGRRLIALHVRHGLRDDAADRDRARAQAAAVGASFHEVAVTVQPAGDGLAAAARRARLDALADAAVQLGARTVLLGHTADDRAETMLLNLARGAGPDGLAAMPSSRPHRGALLAHPLRSVRRSDLRAVATEGPAVANDPGNADRRRRRTRARHEVLPALASLSGGAGDPVAALTRLGDLAADDADALAALAARESARLRRDWGPLVALDADGLASLPVALARRVVRAALADVAGATPSAEAVETTRSLQPGQRCTLAGAVAVARQGRWVITCPEALPALPAVQVAAPGEQLLEPLALRVRVCARHDAPRTEPCRPPAGATPRWPADPVHVAGPCAVRSRRPGDRMLVEGVDRGVSDLLRRAGVPGLARDLVPLVVDADGRIAGLVGVAAADGRAGLPWVLRTEPAARGEGHV